MASDIVKPPRIKECRIEMEGRVAAISEFAAKDRRMAIPTRAIEITIERVHAEEGLQAEGHPSRIDPDLWRPLIMNFRQFYGLGSKLHSSRLGESPEEGYAPWKMKGFKGIATRAVLGLANSKHRAPEPDELVPIPDDHAGGV